MTGILAIETATDACSVAVYSDGVCTQRHEVIPRQHSQRLFGMLRELLPDGDLRKHGIDAIAYGCGPGSFTGLRIAASAVQGLAFAHSLPAIAISTLACQAQTAMRLGLIEEGVPVLSLLDAKINEVYYGSYHFSDGLAVLHEGPGASSPNALRLHDREQRIQAIGSGCRYLDGFDPGLRARIQWVNEAVLPEARDLVPLALASFDSGDIQTPEQVQPVYVREEINWKKLPEQGKRRD